MYPDSTIQGLYQGHLDCGSSMYLLEHFLTKQPSSFRKVIRRRSSFGDSKPAQTLDRTRCYLSDPEHVMSTFRAECKDASRFQWVSGCSEELITSSLVPAPADLPHRHIVSIE